MTKRVSNKKAKQIIVNSALKGRKIFWFGEISEKFLAKSLDEVICLHREIIGDDETIGIVESGAFGEIKMSVKNWFEIKCWNEETGQMEPSINAAYDSECAQICTSYL